MRDYLKKMGKSREGEIGGPPPSVGTTVQMPMPALSTERDSSAVRRPMMHAVHDH